MNWIKRAYRFIRYYKHNKREERAEITIQALRNAGIRNDAQSVLNYVSSLRAEELKKITVEDLK